LQDASGEGSKEAEVDAILADGQVLIVMFERGQFE
jgi:hypothetical protein